MPRSIVWALAGLAGGVAALWGAGLVSMLAGAPSKEVSEPAAVLVLGSRPTVDGRRNPCLESRVRHGADLVRRGVAPVLVVSGGRNPADGIVEADVMADIAREQGLDEELILREPRATSTIENLTSTERLLEDPSRPLIVVTEPYHAARASFAADRLGIDAGLSPSPECPDRGWTWILREPTAIVWYWWKLR